MNPRERLLSFLPLVLAALAPSVHAQMISRLEYGTPPLIFTMGYGPSALGPATLSCGFFNPPFCMPLIPAVNGGVYPPLPNAIGGMAVDEPTGTVYTTDGTVALAAQAYNLFIPGAPSCGPGFVFPLAAWPGVTTVNPMTGMPNPIVGMCDAAEPGQIWVMDAGGLVSRIPFPPGPPTAQAFAPAAILPDPATGNVPTGLTFDPFFGLLWFVCSNTVPAPPGPPIPPPVGVIGAIAPTGFVPGSLIPVASFLVPCPIVGAGPVMDITVNTTVLPGLLPDLIVFFNNGEACDLATAPLPTVCNSIHADAEFVDAPHIYGTASGCGPHIGWSGGFPVLGNGAFTVTAGGISSSSFLAMLLLSTSPAWPSPIIAIPPLTIWVNIFGPTFFLGPVPVFPGPPGTCQGSAFFPMPIPSVPVGTTVYFEWAAFPSNSPGIVADLSEGMEVRVGMP